MNRLFPALAAACLCAAPATAAPLDDMTIDAEVGPLYFLQNDNRYGAAGTAYDAGTVALNRNLFIAQRLSAEARFAERHTVIFLYAPLDVTTRVALEAPLTFRGATFPAGSVVAHRYLFDGLRGSYMYRLYDGGGLSAELGGSLQVRNAEVSLTDLTGVRFAAERDIGLVPALKGRLRYDTATGLYAMLEADGSTTLGLGPTRGGLLDAALTLGVPLRSGLDGTLRLRYLAGGAEVPSREIDNWGQFLVASAGVRWSLSVR